MKKFILVLLIVGVAFQFFPIDRTNPTATPAMDFLHTRQQTPETTAHLIKSTCYDCHSNKSKYPWYTNIQPVGWFVKKHIDEGRQHLNFSEFNTYDTKTQARKLEECADELEKGGMPLSSYTLVHTDAKLSAEQRQELVQYFRKQAKHTQLFNIIKDLVIP